MIPIQRNRIVIRSIMIITVFLICLYGAYYIDTSYMPDEWARKTLSDWICMNMALPTGKEPELIMEMYGFSYASRPYLASFIGAVFTKLFSCFSDDPRLLYLGSRMSSVLSIPAVCCFSLKIGDELFKKPVSSELFAILICFTPQVLFIGMFQNCDALSLACVSAVVLFFIRIIKSNWSIKSCVMMGISVSVCLLSYYNVYGWLMIAAVLLIISALKTKAVPVRVVIQRILIMLGIVMCLAAPVFIRNAMVYDGDFLGISAEKAAVQAFENSNEGSPFMPINKMGFDAVSTIQFYYDLWIPSSCKSLIGFFGTMKISMSDKVYAFYDIGILFGIVMAVICLMVSKKNQINKYALALMSISSLITVALSAYASYIRDLQYQGRYICSILLLISYLIVYGQESMSILIHGDNSDSRLKVCALQYTTAVAVIGMFVYVGWKYMSQMLG